MLGKSGDIRQEASCRQEKNRRDSTTRESIVEPNYGSSGSGRAFVLSQSLPRVTQLGRSGGSKYVLVFVVVGVSEQHRLARTSADVVPSSGDCSESQGVFWREASAKLVAQRWQVVVVVPAVVEQANQLLQPERRQMYQAAGDATKQLVSEDRDELRREGIERWLGQSDTVQRQGEQERVDE